MRSRGFLAISVAALTLALVAGLAAPGAGATTKHRARASQQLPYQNANLPVQQRVDDLLSRMTPEEKIGQMTQAERSHFASEATISGISENNLGSLLSGGGSVPTPNTPTAWANMVDRFQKEAVGNTRPHIPLIYGIDTGHGDGDMFGAPGFPDNIRLGASRDPRPVSAVAHGPAPGTPT